MAFDAEKALYWMNHNQLIKECVDMKPLIQTTLRMGMITCHDSPCEDRLVFDDKCYSWLKTVAFDSAAAEFPEYVKNDEEYNRTRDPQ